MNEDNRYDDIINLPHHVSKTRPRMSLYDRAAQFASFAALTGHEDAIEETARRTDNMVEMDEYAMDDIDNELRYIRENINIMPEVCIRYFRPDSKKSGGSYLEHRGNVKKIDENSRRLIFTDGTGIDISFIVYISH